MPGFSFVLYVQLQRGYFRFHDQWLFPLLYFQVQIFIPIEMIEEIKAWIGSDQDYQCGLALYLKHGRSKSLMRVLSIGGETSKSNATLIYELERILVNATSEKIVKTAEKIDRIAPVNTGTLPVNTISSQATGGASSGIVRRVNTPEIDQLIQQKIMLLKEWDSLHATLELVDQPIRLLNALRILEIGDILDDMYNRLDHYNKHGVLPPAKVFPKYKWESSKPFDIAKRRTTLRTYVTREKKLIRDARTDATQTIHQNLLVKYQLELNQIERNINP